MLFPNQQHQSQTPINSIFCFVVFCSMTQNSQILQGFKCVYIYSTVDLFLLNPKAYLALENQIPSRISSIIVVTFFCYLLFSHAALGQMQLSIAVFYQHSVLVFQIINFLFCICCFLLKCISSTLCFLSRRNMDVPISQVKLSAQFFLKQFKTCSRYTLICLTLSTSAAHFPSPAVRHAKCSFILMVFAGVCILWNSLKLSQLRVFCLWSLLSVPD